jgi:hypothetical protein
MILLTSMKSNVNFFHTYIMNSTNVFTNFFNLGLVNILFSYKDIT